MPQDSAHETKQIAKSCEQDLDSAGHLATPGGPPQDLDVLYAAGVLIARSCPPAQSVECITP